MISFFIYDYVAHDQSGKILRTQVVFCAQETVTPDSLWEHLKEYAASNMPPDRFVFLANKVNKDRVNSIIRTSDFADKLRSLVRSSDEPEASIFYFSPTGELWEVESDSLCRDDVRELIKTEGLLTIFRNRHGILGPSDAYHFKKPSGEHSSRFIRTANVLIHGVEVSFIACWLLRYLNEGTRFVYCDTSSIASVIYAAIQMKKSLDAQFNCPLVDSFESYSGLNRGFKFAGQGNSLIFISASTSGTLADHLIAKPFYMSAQNIVTLFYLSKNKTQGQVLCNLTMHPNSNPQGFSEIQNYDESNCELCAKGSTRLSLVGDQFLPGQPIIDEHLITINDMPSGLSDFLAQVVGARAAEANSQIIRCHYSEPQHTGHPVVRDFYIDVESIFGENLLDFHTRFPILAKKFEKILMQGVPASVDRIIHLDDPASQKMASMVASQFNAMLGTERNIEVRAAADMLRDADFRKPSNRAIVVVAGCIASGRALLGVSQSLRNLQEVGAVVFLVGIVRSRNKHVFEEIKSHVTYGAYGSKDYDFYFLRGISMPEDLPRPKSIWEEEIDVLKQIKEYASLQRCAQLTEIEEIANLRIKTIEDSMNPSLKGLVNNLFWPNICTNDALNLRRNIAFFKFDHNPLAVPQSIIFFLMTSILHSLREGTDRDPVLVQHEHQRVLLSPRCFDRFNDGVMQASLLRAALRSEIDYSISEAHSESMKGILACIFRSFDQPQGEATMEFLISLASGRLRMKAAQTTALIEDLLALINDRDGISPIARPLCCLILEKVQQRRI